MIEPDLIFEPDPPAGRTVVRSCRWRGGVEGVRRPKDAAVRPYPIDENSIDRSTDAIDEDRRYGGACSVGSGRRGDATGQCAGRGAGGAVGAVGDLAAREPGLDAGPLRGVARLASDVVGAAPRGLADW
jgi:hypothetical protein